MSIERSRSQRMWVAVAVVAAVLLALPFAAGAILLTIAVLGLPDSPAARIETARVLGAALFAFGLSLGLIGSAVALTAQSACRRALATATTLFGCSHLLLGYIIGRSMDTPIGDSRLAMLPMVVPVLLWAYSVWLAIRAARMESPASEEQQQPLSRS